MLVLAVCLFSAVAGTVSAADRPVWFLNDDKSVTADGCDTLLKSGGVESTNGAIYIPEDKAASICIRFPDTVTLEDGRQLKGGWRHHFGSRGVCSQGCCEYFPPGAKKADIKHPAWFETSSDCSNAASKQSLPLYVQGQEGGKKKICIEDEEGKLVLREGNMVDCGLKCCLLQL